MAEVTSKESTLTHTEVTNYSSFRKNGSVLVYDYPVQYEPYRNWTEGVKNPHFRTQVILGQNATTPFEGYSYQIEEDPYWSEATCHLGPSASGLKFKKHTSFGHHEFPNANAIEAEIASIPLGEANTVALGRLVEDIRDKHASFKGSTTLAELTKTIAQLRNPAKALRKGVSDYLETIKRYGKRWTKAGRKAALDALTGTYLEATYGWAPFLGDIDNIKTAISESYDKDLHERLWAHGVGEAVGYLHSTSRRYSSHYHSTIFCPWVNRRYMYYVTVKYSSMLDYSVTGGKSRNLGFTPREWAPALLEVIPWSFVAAYFTNIDEIITALSYVGSNVAFTNKTTRQVYIDDYVPLGTFKSRSKYSYETAPPTIVGNLGYGRLEGKRVRRDVYDGLLIPPPAFHLPGSGRKWLNLGALAVANRKALRSLAFISPQEARRRGY